MKYDFGGWATRNDLQCADGRVIKKDAFKGQNGQTVPLVWMHNHADPANVLGLAHLENRDEGVYAFCEFNDTESGKTARELVKHGDVQSLSIFANQLTVGGGSGLNRRELFTDARDISSNVGSDDALTDAEYMAQLQQRGKEKLAENVSITSFEGETETTIMFQYGKDFFNGDIVQIANEYGHETKARILEIVRSEDKDGYSVYPTFKTIEQEGA